MRALSLFSGIGGFELGLSRAGVQIAASVEIDAAARGVLLRHWPDVVVHPDVREVGAGSVEAVELVCGGFPCQDLSVAGRRAGLVGERSGLWWEFHRVLSKLRPRWCVVENVPGLLSSNSGRDMGAILWSLGQLGYGYAYRVLDARFFGLAQRRRRVLIVGCLGDGRRAAQVLLEPEGLRRDLASSGAARADVAGTLGSQPAGSGFRADLDRSGAFIVNAAESCATASHARAAEVARALDTTGGFSANQGGTVVAHALTDSGNGRMDPNGETLIAFDPRNITSRENRSNPRPGDPCCTLHADPPMIADAPGRRREDDENLVVFNWQNSASQTLRVDRDAADPLRVSSIPAVAYQCHGTNVGPLGALRAGNGNETGGVPFTEARVGVRRLTPTECERLQGFPDGWTLGQSDAARYRQLGNAFPPPMAEWVARRILAAEAAARPAA